MQKLGLWPSSCTLTITCGWGDDLWDRDALARTIDDGDDEAANVLASIEAVGVDMADVAETLERQGVAAFQASYDQLISAIGEKAAALQRGAA